MLEKKLGEARQRRSKLILQVLIGFFIVIVASALILLSLPYFESTTPKNTTASVSKIKKISESDLSIIREEFKELFQRYKSELKPRLYAANLKDWNQKTLLELNEQEEYMMLYFSNGDYFNALAGIKSLTTKAIEVIDEADKIFKDNIEKATSFFSDDLYYEAKLYIEKALVVAPQSTKAQVLQQNIEKLQQILPFLNKANVARAENNLLNESNSLEEILKINSKRPVEAERLELIKRMIRNNKFDNHISLGFSEIENHETKKARYHYQKAEKIYPERPELKALLKQILIEEKSYRTEQALKQAEQATREDNWVGAMAEFEKAKKNMPSNEEAIKGIKLAKEILRLQSVLAQYEKSPYRLTDNGVLNEAKKILEHASHFSKQSSILRKKIKQLSELISTFNQLISVMVTSDNMTDIQVRGIGKLGSIYNKTIELKPGYYTFEGTRNGFKSKLLQVLIPYNKNNYSVRIICDEPI